MAILRIAGFLGENRALHPLLLPPGVGVTSTNHKPTRGDLRPWNAMSTVATVPATRATIYRMGRDTPSDTNYWLSWTTTVHAVRGFNAADTAERTYYTGSGAPKWTDTTKALASAPYPTAYRDLGIPAPASAVTLSVSGGTSTKTETRFYVYTYVSDIGEEGAPSPVSAELTCKIDDTVTISSILGAPSGAYGITAVRIYRTDTGSTSSSFFFLREISVGTTSTTDDNRALGEVLPSADWLQPPSDLKFLTGMWNGMMAGISGRSVRFCEAYVPYAWPLAYEILPAHTTPVALATFGQTLVILTNGRPIVVTGGSPDALDEAPIEFLQACIAPLSAVSMGNGVAWASPDGLAFTGEGGARLLTDRVMTRDDWQAINPTTIRGCFHERRYIGFYTQGTRKAFIVDPANPQGMYFLDFGADALHMDDTQDALYLLDGLNIKKWDAGSALTVTFKSAPMRAPKPIRSYAFAEVVADAYPVTFKLYADGVLKHTQTVASATPFALPSGYYGQSFQVELSGTSAIQSAAVAHSMRELASV